MMAIAKMLDNAATKNILNLVRGREMNNTPSSEIEQVRITDIVEASCLEKLNCAAAIFAAKMLTTTVIPVGIALYNILCRKLPFIRSLLGSKASRNEGMPILSTPISVR